MTASLELRAQPVALAERRGNVLVLTCNRLERLDHVEGGLWWAGQAHGLIDRIDSCADVIRVIIGEAEATIGTTLPALLAPGAVRPPSTQWPSPASPPEDVPASDASPDDSAVPIGREPMASLRLDSSDRFAVVTGVAYR